MSWGTLRIPILFSLEKTLQWILSRWMFQNYSVATWKPDLIFSLCSEKRNMWIRFFLNFKKIYMLLYFSNVLQAYAIFATKKNLQTQI